MSEENENEEGQEEEEEEEDAPSGPISGALPTIPDIVKMVGLCDCIKATQELCCPPKEFEGSSKAGSAPTPPGDPTPVGMCKLIETNISMAFAPQLNFALGFEVILDIPPKPPLPPIPGLGIDLDLKLFGLPSLDVPAFPLPMFDLSLPGLDIPGFFPSPIPFPPSIPFPGLPFFGIVLFPIDFAIGLFSLDIKIPIPTADPCTLIEAVGLLCPPIPGLPQLNIALCLLKIILLLLMVLAPLLGILVGLGVVSIGDDGKMLDENGEEVEIPPPLVVGNPEDNREKVETFTETDDEGNEKEIVDPGVKVNEFNKNTRVTIVAKKFDLKKAFSRSRFSVGPEVIADEFDQDEEGNSIRAGLIEGDENEDGSPGPEESNMEYEWRIYAPEKIDETDVVALIGSLGFTTEDEKDENGEVIPGGIPAGTFKPKTLDERTPIFTQTKSHRRDGANARKITFVFPKIGNYEVVCFAKKTRGSQPVLETQKLQTIIKIGESGEDGVWRSNKKPTELPEVLKEMTMPPELSHIVATEFPILPEDLPEPAQKAVAQTPKVVLPKKDPQPKPAKPTPPKKKEEIGV